MRFSGIQWVTSSLIHFIHRQTHTHRATSHGRKCNGDSSLNYFNFCCLLESMQTYYWSTLSLPNLNEFFNQFYTTVIKLHVANRSTSSARALKKTEEQNKQLLVVQHWCAIKWRWNSLQNRYTSFSNVVNSGRAIEPWGSMAFPGSDSGSRRRWLIINIYFN